MCSLAFPQLVLLSVVVILLAGNIDAASTSLRFELLPGGHVPHHKNGRRERSTIGGYITAVARADVGRQEMIHARLEERWRRHGRARKAYESNCTDAHITSPPPPPPPPPPPTSSFALPVFSGAYAGTGQYFVRFQVGTPAQKFMLVLDTGSDLTWMKCRYNGTVVAPAPGSEGSGSGGNGGSTGSSDIVVNNVGRSRDRNNSRVFDSGSSMSFRPIGCSTALCKGSLPFSLAQCPSVSAPCSYDYRYGDGSRAQGVFANELASAVQSPSGRRAKLANIVVGCTSSFSGQSFQASDGVLGLGYSKTSFAATATSLFGGKFSYCLVDHLSPKTVSNYLVFGEGGGITRDRRSGASDSGSIKTTLRYAELVLDPHLEPFYAVNVAGISIGGSMLGDIPLSTWDVSSGGGAIVDSGTSLTILDAPAYKSVTAALNQAMLAYPRLADVVKPFEFCYNITPAAFKESSVPSLVIHLRDANGSGVVDLEPPVKSYLVDVADGVKCLGFLPAPSPGLSTFGNILQQNHRWEFDIANKRLGFAPSSC